MFFRIFYIGVRTETYNVGAKYGDTIFSAGRTLLRSYAPLRILANCEPWTRMIGDQVVASAGQGIDGTPRLQSVVRNDVHAFFTQKFHGSSRDPPSPHSVIKTA